MRVPTTAAFNKFLMDNGQSYPYSRLHATRNSFFCKWLMQKGQSRLGLTYYFPTMANSLRVSLLDAIAIDGAKPIPPELFGIMDDMFWWGKTRSYEWYERLVDLLGLVLDDGEEIDIRSLVRELIGLRVAAILKEYFAVDSLAFSLLYDKYSEWFFWTYDVMDFYHGHKYPFRTMAETSFEYIEWCIGEVIDAPETPTS
jgi:hypothetical protein